MPEAENTFFKFGVANWWKIREQFRRTVPATVTATYLATALSQQEKSVRVNILPPLKRMGLIDEKGKPTELAYDWRDDEKYPEVCRVILEQNYPQELRDLFGSDSADDKKLKDWFARVGKVGDTTAKMMAAFYRLLLRANPNEQTTKKEPNLVKPSKAAIKGNPRMSTTKAKTEAPEDANAAREITKTDGTETKHPYHSSKGQATFSSAPQLHINIQLHISPETTAEQIEKIFESMARNLKELSI